jgi:hypothetical protein
MVKGRAVLVEEASVEVPLGPMPLALTVDIGWPWWAITVIASGVLLACLAGFIVFRSPASRAVAGLLAVEGIVIAILAPFVMPDMDSNGSATAAGAGGMSSRSSSAVIHVIEHAPPPNMRMVGGVLTFANPIFDKRNAKRIGRDQGFCLDIALVKSSECVSTTFLPGGQITTEGPVSDTEATVVAITGGTGKYENARGWAETKAHNKAGTEFDIIFHLSG